MPDPRSGGPRTLFWLLILAVLAAASTVGWVGAHRVGTEDAARPAALLAPFEPVLDTVASMLSRERYPVVAVIDAPFCQAAVPAPASRR